MRGILLTSFTVGKKEYLCYLVDDKIVYRVKINKKISNNFSKKEKILMDRVFPKLLVSSKSKNDIVKDERLDIIVDNIEDIAIKAEKILVGFFLATALSLGGDLIISKVLPYSHKKIVKELDQNDELSKEEADYFEDCLVILDDNKEYVNQHLIQSRMKDIDCKWYYGFESKSDSLAGFYNIFSNYISVRADSYDTMNDNERQYLTHEIIHSFCPARHTGIALDEAITEQLTSEYLSVESNIYGDQRIYMAALCEIIGTDPLLEFYFGGSTKPIIKELNKIDENDIKAEKLIENIDKTLENSRSFSEYISKENRELINEIYSSLDNYFYIKYGYHMNEDDIMANLFINSRLCDVENKSNIQNIIYPYIGGFFTKSYVNKNGTTGFYYFGEDGEVLKQGIVSTKSVPKKDNAKKLYLKYNISED